MSRWQPRPLTESDNVPADWLVWWRWSSATGQWTRHERDADLGVRVVLGRRGGQ